MSALELEGCDADLFCSYVTSIQLTQLRVELARVRDAIACEQRIANPDTYRPTALQMAQEEARSPSYYEACDIISALPVLRSQLEGLRKMTDEDVATGKIK